MATTTPRIGLTKPDLTDLVDVGVLNTNFDKIDSNIASTKIQATKPTTANAGDLWWDSDTGTLYVYYTDANSSQWVAATSDPINIGVVANQTERDAQYPTPAQGMRVFRTDLGVTQTYYGLYNVSTNPGGRTTAGWYGTEKSMGIVPVRPASVNLVSGTGGINAVGEVSFTNATSVELLNVFTADYDTYRIIFQGTRGGTASIEYLHMRVGSSAGVFTSANYVGGFNGIESGYTATMNVTNSSAGTFALGSVANSGQYFSGEVILAGPFLASKTMIFSQMLGFQQGNAQGYNYSSGFQGDATSFPSLGMFASGGKPLTGTIQVFGYNNK